MGFTPKQIVMILATAASLSAGGQLGNALAARTADNVAENNARLDNEGGMPRAEYLKTVAAMKACNHKDF